MLPAIEVFRPSGGRVRPNKGLKLPVRLAALARAQRGPYCIRGASAAKAPARSLSPVR